MFKKGKQKKGIEGRMLILQHNKHFLVKETRYCGKGTKNILITEKFEKLKFGKHVKNEIENSVKLVDSILQLRS